MDDEAVAQTLIRLVNERPNKQWYLKKSHYAEDIDWGNVCRLVSEQGYFVQDQGSVVLGKLECL